MSECQRTCGRCGKVWYSDLSEEKTANRFKNLSLLQAFASLRMSAQALQIANMRAAEADLTARKRCPSCGSTNYTQGPPGYSLQNEEQAFRAEKTHATPYDIADDENIAGDDEMDSVTIRKVEPGDRYWRFFDGRRAMCPCCGFWRYGDFHPGIRYPCGNCKTAVLSRDGHVVERAKDEDIISKLERLSELRKLGTVTEDEFLELKRKLLA